MKTMLLVATAATFFGVSATSALAENVATPTNSDGWSAANVRAAGSVGITGTYKPSTETGSLQFTTGNVTNGTDKADFVHTLNGTLGDLAFNGAASIAYDYYVNSSSGALDHLAPALRLYFLDAATNKTGYLIYEPVYNGYPVSTGGPQDSWVHADITNANFWMRTFGPSATVEKYDYTLDDWANGRTAPGSFVLSSATQILGIEIGVGSGWNGSFNGAVDHVLVDFGRVGATGVSTNFEVSEATAAVPEPATWAMMIAGFGLVGGAMRRRKTSVAFA